MPTRAAVPACDLIVADVRMPPDFTDEGLRAALEVSVRWPEVAVLVLSQYVEERYATKLLAGRTSRIGYLLKDRVAGGGTVLGAALFVSDSAVAKHVNSILAKLDLAPADSDHRRVLAVLRFLGAG